MSLWAVVKQSICKLVAFYEVDFHFMDSFKKRRSVRTDSADFGILTNLLLGHKKTNVIDVNCEASLIFY